MEAPLEMPALDLTGVAPYGLKKDGTPAKKRGRQTGWKKKDSDSSLDPEAQSMLDGLTEEITSPEQLADLLAATFAIPGALVDESFDLTDSSGRPNQRCIIAAKRMFPLCKKYGTASIAKWFPEILAVWGLIELVKPAVGPTIEIIAGVRQPLINRPMAIESLLPVTAASDTLPVA